MSQERNQELLQQPWGDRGPRETLGQIAGLLEKRLSAKATIAGDGSTFRIARGGSEEETRGLLSVVGQLTGGGAGLRLVVELVRLPDGVRTSTAFVAQLLDILEVYPRAKPPIGSKNMKSAIWVELKGKAVPMGFSRESVFLSKIGELDEAARKLQAELPRLKSYADLLKAYDKTSELLTPIRPWQPAGGQIPAELDRWARDNLDFVAGGSSLAIVSPFSVCVDLALAAMAQVCMGQNNSLGSFRRSHLEPSGLLELVGVAPGIVVLEALRLSLGTNPYLLSDAVRAMLRSLAADGKPVVFTGSLGELQSVFHGGQGAECDPLQPVVRHVPEMALDLCAEFAVHQAGQELGGIPGSVTDAVIRETLGALDNVPAGQRRRLLPAAARRAVHVHVQGPVASAVTGPAFVRQLDAATETLGGLHAGDRAHQKPHVRERFTRLLTDPGLLAFLKDRLWGQDPALEELVLRLSSEILTRPAHQCLRYCAQGIPGVGKSQSALLLSRWLGVPFVNIDAASMPDHYTASAQLLGSGRGIVGSHESGRLEKAARHHQGAVVEISDLDHAPVHVRSSLSDLFLQVLETGEAQSAAGSTFSCANLIFAFTLNLPGGQDERAWRPLGFNDRVTRKDVRSTILTDLKGLLSGAFMSRVGTPILFESLSEPVMASIVEKALVAAVRSATERLGLPAGDVSLSSGVGAELLRRDRLATGSLGARTLLENGRAQAAKAVLAARSRGLLEPGRDVCLALNQENELILEEKRNENHEFSR